MNRMNPVSEYLRHTLVTDPGALAAAFDDLPSIVPELVRTVQGLLLHTFWTKQYAVTATETQKRHVRTRLVSRILEVLLQGDPSPLTAMRPLDKRFFGNCRDFSVLLCSMLRSKGIPARARCGFGTYFWHGRFEDHWICEYWTGARWARVDAQLDEVQRKVLGIDFDTLDIPAGEFVNASEAWVLCRSGEADPAAFGIFDMHGLDFVMGNLIRELAALNDAEMLPWDMWGIMCPQKDWTERHIALFDRVAELLIADGEDIHTIYENEPGLRVPRDMIVPGF